MATKVRIAVVGHLPERAKFPAGFEFIKRKSDTEFFPTIKPEYKFVKDSYVWSEFSAWFENSQIINDAQVTGLYHYRCALNLYGVDIQICPLFLRYFFLRSQISKFQRKKDFLFVGNPNFVSQSVWNQFDESHPESIEFLKLAAESYDNLFGRDLGNSEKRLKSMTYYYPRNTFVSDTYFARDWMRTAYEIAVNLNRGCRNTPENRWGGFVLERIFSLFVDDYITTSSAQLFTLQQTYFVKVSTILKIQLLKIPPIAHFRIRLKRT